MSDLEILALQAKSVFGGDELQSLVDTFRYFPS